MSWLFGGMGWGSSSLNLIHTEFKNNIKTEFWWKISFWYSHKQDFKNSYCYNYKLLHFKPEYDRDL